MYRLDYSPQQGRDHFGHESVVHEIRPGSARVLVTELSDSGNINPSPAGKPCEDAEAADEPYVPPGRLELLCGSQDRSHLTSLEFCIDTKKTTLGNFGAHLPRLMQLKMNNSLITSVRDLGTSLPHLQVLWMSCCSLKDLDGISAFSSLKELYIAYNNVSDLSQVAMLENLELLDLEGNDVDDLVQIQYLGLCLKLHTLTLEGNPVCARPHTSSSQITGYSYRTAVRELVPQLRYLDDVKVEEEGLTCSGVMGENWDILRNLIKEIGIKNETTADSVCPDTKQISARRPSSSPSCIRPMTATDFRTSSGSRSMSAMRPGVLAPSGFRAGSPDFDLAAVDAETSTLMHGAGKILFCGNPVQAIRARREKLRTAPTRSSLRPCALPIHVPEHTYDLKELDVGERMNVLAELKAWREQHSRRLQAIEKGRLPQVLAIHHGADEETDCVEEKEFGDFRSKSSNEIQKEGKHRDSPDATKLDSPFQSLSTGQSSPSTTDQHERETLYPSMARQSLSSDATLSPSPPLATVDPASRKMPGMRARRLRVSQENSKKLPDFNRKACDSGTVTTAEETDPIFRKVANTHVPPLSSTCIPIPPPASDLHKGHVKLRVDVDLPSVHSGHKHEMPKAAETQAISCYRAAKATLLKHQQHHLLRLCRGSSHPD